jgi:hypothetical protein
VNIDTETRNWLVATIASFVLLIFVGLSFIGNPPVVTLDPALQATLGIAALATLGIQVGMSYGAVRFQGAVQESIREA